MCKYCNIKKGCSGEALPTAYHHGMWIECFNENQDYILSVGNVGILRIEYCPMCGRELKEFKTYNEKAYIYTEHLTNTIKKPVNNLKETMEIAKKYEEK